MPLILETLIVDLASQFEVIVGLKHTIQSTLALAVYMHDARIRLRGRLPHSTCVRSSQF
jgi:hypothetical protein